MSNSPNNTESRFFLWKIMDFLEKFISIATVAIMTAVVFVAVILRYVFRSPLGWSEEFTLICLTWCVFGSASYAFYHGLNVGVTFLVDRIHGKARHIMEIIILVITAAFMGVLFVYGIKLVSTGMGRFTNAAHIPMWIPYLAIPVGSCMCILRLVEMIGEQVKKLGASEQK